MKVLITGGTGFLGRHAAVRLKKLGHTVRVLGRNRRAGEALERFGVEFCAVDLADEARVAQACERQEGVIHCAGLASPWGKYDDFYQANVIGTQNLVKGCQAHSVRRIVHLSTPSLYFDYRDRLNIRESDPLPRPATPYAATKLLADREIERVRQLGLETVSLRPRAIFGPGDNTVLGRLLRAAEQGTLPLIGGGNSLADLTYIDNVVDALVLALTSPQGTLGQVYNITNGEPVSMRALLDRLLPKLGLRPRLYSIPFPVARVLALGMETFYRLVRPQAEPPLTQYAVGLMAKSQTLDITRARQELGYRPQVSLEEGLDRFARWWPSRTGDEWGLGSANSN
jgi:nucleoside-diphosphate-sugar epimerase